jgi:threonine aldolase
MANQVAILLSASSGDEIILDDKSHTFNYEAGGAAFNAGVQTRTLKSDHGLLDPSEIEAAIRPPGNYHLPRTALICLENTHNLWGGRIVPLQNMEAIRSVARKHGIRVHLDGARIFNASVASGVPVKKYAACADTVMFCLSKGLCAPIGSILLGSKGDIVRAVKLRKMLGGAMRQVGIIAAAGIVALEEMVDRLAEDHENARKLAEGFASLHGLSVNLEYVDTNIVIVNTSPELPPAIKIEEALREHGILALALGPRFMRFVTHHDVNSQDVDRTLSIMRKIITSL